MKESEARQRDQYMLAAGSAETGISNVSPLSKIQLTEALLMALMVFGHFQYHHQIPSAAELKSDTWAEVEHNWKSGKDLHILSFAVNEFLS